nr:hypothetical protein [uncultured Erythrobacter sp.]
MAFSTNVFAAIIKEGGAQPNKGYANGYRDKSVFNAGRYRRWLDDYA